MAVAVGLLQRRLFALCFIFLFTLFLPTSFIFFVHLLRALELVAQPSTLIYILSIRHIYILYILLLYFMATFHGNFISVNRQLARSRFNQIHFTSLNRLIIYWCNLAICSIEKQTNKPSSAHTHTAHKFSMCVCVYLLLLFRACTSSHLNMKFSSLSLPFFWVVNSCQLMCTYHIICTLSASLAWQKK